MTPARLADLSPEATRGDTLRWVAGWLRTLPEEQFLRTKSEARMIMGLADELEALMTRARIEVV